MRGRGGKEEGKGEGEGNQLMLSVLTFTCLLMCKVTLKCVMFPLGGSGASHCSRTLEVVTELST